MAGGEAPSREGVHAGAIRSRSFRMETMVILAAVAATVIGCVLMAGLFRAGRREPLRLPQEQDWADDEAGTIRKLTPTA